MNFAQLFLILQARKSLILKVLATVVLLTLIVSLLMPRPTRPAPAWCSISRVPMP